MIDTFDPTGQDIVVHELQTNPLPGWTPISNGGDSIEVARPSNDALMRHIDSRLVFISSDSFKAGEYVPANEKPFDLSECLGQNETIQAPSGGPALFSPPTSKSPDESEGALSSAVLVFDQDSTVPSAVIGLDCSRYDLSDSAAEGSYVVPRTTDSSQVVVRSGDVTTVLLESAAGDSGRIVFEIDDPAVEILLPGQAVVVTRPTP